MMRRLMFVFSLALGISAVIASAGGAAAETRTVVWQVNLSVPIVNKSALGTLTTNFDSDTGEGTWVFQGTIGGAFAQASGAGTMSGSGSSVQLTLTSIDEWQMPGIGQPSLPTTASVRVVGGIAYVSYSPQSGLASLAPIAGLPVAVSPSLSFPPESGTYVVTVAGSGAQGVTEIPKTGGPLTAASGLAGRFMPLWLSVVLLFALGGAAVGLVFERRGVRHTI